MSPSNNLILVTVGVVMMASLWEPVSAHGRLWTPPARGTMWRRGYQTPVNYDDNQMFCGGFIHQVNLGYMCGVCGDPYDAVQPRPNEAGGPFATGIITAEYIQGQVVNLQVDITANHKGWFEFRICPTNNFTKEATHECFNQNLLQLADGSGTRLNNVGLYGNRMIDIAVKLPEDLTCDFCTLQWRYHAGNNWGEENGVGCIGCGLQEEFYGCADVKISPSTPTNSVPRSSSSPRSSAPPMASTNVPGAISTIAPEETSTTAPEAASTAEPEETSTAASSSSVPHIFSCAGIPDTAAMATWCNDNCNHIPINCPVLLCQCQRIKEPRFNIVSAPGCYATTPYHARRWNDWDRWCSDNCALGNCPANSCFCKT